MYLEFVVPGPPISNQSTGSPALLAWRTTIEAEANKAWTNPPLSVRLKAVIINFHKGNNASLDLDNMSKPILDSLEGIVYDDDRQITQSELTALNIAGPLVIVGASKL